MIVRPGAMSVIAPQNLTVDTNLNMDPRNIQYELANITNKSPLWLLHTLSTERNVSNLASIGRVTRLFTQDDINKGRVLYYDEFAYERRDDFLHLRVVAGSNLEVRSFTL